VKTMSVLNFLSYFLYYLYYLPLVVFSVLSLLLLPVLLLIGMFAPSAVGCSFLHACTEFFERKEAEMRAAQKRLSRKELS